MSGKASMTKHQKIKWYATGRCSAEMIQQIIDGDIVRFYVPKLRGSIVCLKRDSYRHPDKEGAVAEAREFRECMRRRLLAVTA